MSPTDSDPIAGLPQYSARGHAMGQALAADEKSRASHARWSLSSTSTGWIGKMNAES
jgi:hypothetical protein